MKELIVSAQARADLAAIRAYSRKEWGPEQAAQYVAIILSRFAWLMLNASRGRRQDEILPGLRRINVRRHAIFYVDHADAVEIARVLHQQMDYARQFRATPFDDRD